MGISIKGKKVLVFGAGKSGIASVKLLLEKGADTVLYDNGKNLCESDIRKKSEVLKGVRIITGELKDTEIEELSLAVLSPGVPLDLAEVKKLKAHGIKLWGEIELAYQFAKGRLIAITGTNGKTTTTALTGEILKSFYQDVEVAGNIGIPYTSLVTRMTQDTVTVAEISSFQLETADTFCPEISVILNITPDHLNRHHTMECYISMKESITKNQKPGQYCILNYEDETLRDFGKTLSLNVIYFSSKRKLEKGLYLDENTIYLAGDDGVKKVADTGELNLLGIHNYENVMAAAAAASAAGVPLEKITEVLKTFQAVEHRIEYVGEFDGVRYYNDSKATNTDDAIQGIRAMQRPVYLIGGGYDKQAEYGSWIDAFEGKVKKLVLIGETKENIAKAAKEKGFTDTVMCQSFEEAVNYCRDSAQPGEAVLLSPACASWDMFKSYEERGRRFKEIVRGLKLC